MRAFALALALALTACSRGGDGESSSIERRCEQLRDHMVELRLGDPPPKDVEKHRKVLRRALGSGFITSCTSTMNDDDITCALAARDLTAAAGCTQHAAAAASN